MPVKRGRGWWVELNQGAGARVWFDWEDVVLEREEVGGGKGTGDEGGVEMLNHLPPGLPTRYLREQFDRDELLCRTSYKQYKPVQEEK